MDALVHMSFVEDWWMHRTATQRRSGSVADVWSLRRLTFTSQMITLERMDGKKENPESMLSPGLDGVAQRGYG